MVMVMVVAVKMQCPVPCRRMHCREECNRWQVDSPRMGMLRGWFRLCCAGYLKTAMFNATKMTAYGCSTTFIGTSQLAAPSGTAGRRHVLGARWAQGMRASPRYGDTYSMPYPGRNASVLSARPTAAAGRLLLQAATGQQATVETCVATINSTSDCCVGQDTLATNGTITAIGNAVTKALATGEETRYSY